MVPEFFFFLFCVRILAMGKDKIKKYISLMLLFLWMYFIFYMSSKTASESSDISSGICYRLCRIFVKGFDELSLAERTAMASSISYLVRKTAHFIEYSILGVLSVFAARQFLAANHYIWSAAFSLLYAVSDEVHQLYVPGRSGQINDVLLDFTGITAGLFISWLAVSYVSKRKTRHRRS